MIEHFHFLRPWCLIILVPLIIIFWMVWRKKINQTAWSEVCDPHLLPHLMQHTNKSTRRSALWLLLAAGISMIIALAGPTWQRLPVPTYRQNVARVVILDMSEAMLEKDLKPNRLTRAKFKLHDLFNRKEDNQFALVVYTGQPFVVSPLTEDSQTIDALLEMLQPDIMPVQGQKMSTALDAAARLIQQAGFSKGQLLVLTASLPDKDALTTAETLASHGIETSILPLISDKSLLPLFKPLAEAGRGLVLSFSDKETDLDQWIKETEEAKKNLYETDNTRPVWRDEGRWFLLPALLMLLPVFRRAWLMRV